MNFMLKFEICCSEIPKIGNISRKYAIFTIPGFRDWKINPNPGIRDRDYPGIVKIVYILEILQFFGISEQKISNYSIKINYCGELYFHFCSNQTIKKGGFALSR